MLNIIDQELADAPSELTIDAYVAGDADAEEVAAVEAWMALDPANAAVIEARQSGFEAFVEARPQVMLARIRQGLEAAEAESRAAHAPVPAPRRWSLTHWVMIAMGGLAAAAAVTLFFVNRPDTQAGAGGPEIILKGDITLRVFRERGGEVQELLSGDAVQAQDKLRFMPEKLPEGEGYLAIAGVEASGALFPYFPADGKAVDPAGRLDDKGVLQHTSVLDDSKGKERAWLIWCPTPFSIADLKADGEALSSPDGCKQTGFELVKPE